MSMSHEKGCGGKAVGLSPYHGDYYDPVNAVDGYIRSYWSTDTYVVPYRKFWWYFSFSDVKVVKMVNIIFPKYCKSIHSVSIVAKNQCWQPLRTLYDADNLKQLVWAGKSNCSGKRHYLSIDSNKIGLYRCYGIQLMLREWNYGAITEVEFYEGKKMGFSLLKFSFFRCLSV